MAVVERTWPYGTTRTGKVLSDEPSLQVVLDDQGEAHILVGNARDPSAVVDDRGVLTFTRGGLTGGFWKFEKAK